MCLYGAPALKSIDPFRFHACVYCIPIRQSAASLCRPTIPWYSCKPWQLQGASALHAAPSSRMRPWVLQASYVLRFFHKRIAHLRMAEDRMRSLWLLARLCLNSNVGLGLYSFIHAFIRLFVHSITNSLSHSRIHSSRP